MCLWCWFPSFHQQRSISWHVFTNFPNINQRNFSTKYYEIFVLILLNAQIWGKSLFWPIRNFFSMQLRITVKKLCRFVFKKFVKTCHELVKRFKICGICSEYFQAICQRWSKVGFSHAPIWLGVKLLEISRFD